MIISESMADSRKSMSINLVPAARESLDRLKAESGVTHAHAMVKILEWFSKLDASLQLAIVTNSQQTKDALTRATIVQLVGREAMQEIIARIGLDGLAALMQSIAERFNTITEAERAGKDCPALPAPADVLMVHQPTLPAKRARRTREKS